VWAPGPVWKFWRRDEFLTPNGIRAPDHPDRSVVYISTTTRLQETLVQRLSTTLHKVRSEKTVISKLFLARVLTPWCSPLEANRSSDSEEFFRIHRSPPPPPSRCQQRTSTVTSILFHLVYVKYSWRLSFRCMRLIGTETRIQVHSVLHTITVILIYYCRFKNSVSLSVVIALTTRKLSHDLHAVQYRECIKRGTAV
jgi:hypothetical protein